jgi:hypothetical protein
LKYGRSSVFTFLFFMQKLSGTSSGKNNKSCRIFHKKTQQNWVCIFLILLRFSTEFTRSSKSQSLLKLQLCSQPPGFSAGSQLCPYFAVKTSESFLTLKCSPWGRWPAWLAGIRRARPRPRLEMGGERVPNPQGLDSGGRSALGGGRRAAHRRPAAGGGGRREPGCGAAEARLRAGEAQAAVLGGRG